MTAMGNYRTQMEADFAALKTALASALPQEAQDRALVQQVQTQIQSIELTLAADNEAATSATIDTSDDMNAMVVGLMLPLEFDPVGFGIALLGFGADIIIDAEAQAQVQSDLSQIQTLSTQLSADQLQLGLMQGIVANLQNLADGIEAALTTFDDFDDTWSFANYGLNYLLVVLAQPQIDIGKIPDLNDLSDAAAAWQKMADFATKVLNVTVTQQQPVTISPS